jgi:hypothetical protein
MRLTGVKSAVIAIAFLTVTACGPETDVGAASPSEGVPRFVVGNQWNFSPGYERERGYVTDYYQFSFPVTNEGTAEGVPVCRGGIGDRWMPILHLGSVQPGKTRWLVGIVIPERRPRPGEESQGVSCDR